VADDGGHRTVDAGDTPLAAPAGRTAEAPGADPVPRIVFCGGCNPQIDRGAVAAELAGPDAGGVQAPEAAGETADPGAGTAGATVYLSGCARACASDHRLTSDTPGEIVVAGEAVDGRPTKAGDLAATIRQKLKE